MVLLQGVGRDAMHLYGIDRLSGALRWEWSAGLPAVAAVDYRLGMVVVAAADKKTIELKALGLTDGVESWRLELSAGEGNPVEPVLLIEEDDVLLASNRIVRVSMSSGRSGWEIPNPAGPVACRLQPMASGLLLWAQNRVWMLKKADGSILWGPLDLGGEIRLLTVSDTTSQAAHAMVHSGIGTFNVRAISLSTGKSLWQHEIKGKVESGLYADGTRLFFSTKENLEGIDPKTGKLFYRTSLPVEFSSRTSEIPDLLTLRAGRIVLSREKSGVACFDAKNGKMLWNQTLDILRMAEFWFKVGEQAFHEAAGIAAQYKQMASTDRQWWNSYLYSWDRHWRTMDVGSSSPLSSPGMSSTSQHQAMMALANSLLALSATVETSLKQGALNALAERKRLEMENSLSLHSRSIQGRYWIRPFKKRGIGVTIVDLDTGKRSDFEFSSPNYGMQKYGLQLPEFCLASGGERLVTAGISLDPSTWERYVKFKYGMPYPSLLAFRLADLRFAPTIWDDQQLCWAAGKGDIAPVKSLVTGRAWVDSRDSSGATPLMAAASKGQDEVVIFLLAQGADPRRNLGDGSMTVVERAAYGGYASTVKLLIQAGADPNEAMRAAARFDKPKVLEAILATGSRPPAATLRDAVLFGDTTAVAKFLDTGSNVESSMDQNNSTPIILAAGKGHLGVVRLLLDRGAKINSQQKTGQKYSALMKAAENGHIDVVGILLERGASINARDGDGMNAVFNAAAAGHAEVLKLLIKAGGDIEVTTNLYKTTPLMEAAAFGKYEAVKVLLAAGASHSKTDKDGNTPLSRASFNGSLEAVQALLTAGAMSNVVNKDGYTPLMRAAEQGHLSVVQALIATGAEINAVNKSGKTVLSSVKQFYFGSSITKKEDMIRALEAAGAK